MDSSPDIALNRILMTADTVGGIWPYALELSRALARHSITIALATMGPLPSAAQREEVFKLPNVHLYCSPFKLEWMEDAWADVSLAGEWLLDLEAEFQPDIIHLNSYVHGSLPWNTPLLVVGHSCVLSWWKSVKGEDPLPRWDQYRKNVAHGLHSADMVVAPSQAMLKSLREFYGTFPYDRVIYTGRSISDLPIRAKENCILAVGQPWDEAKNLIMLDQIADRLHWPVYIAGEFPYSSSHESKFTNAHFLGKLSSEELNEWFARAAIYALPARYEPFNQSVLDAAIAGCALVLGDTPNLRELWHGAAVFVPPNDPDALLAALDSLIADTKPRIEKAVLARQRAHAYSAECMAEEYLKVYTGLRSAETAPSLLTT